MKKVLYSALLVSLLVGLCGLSTVLAQGSWNTGIDVQNLSGTDGFLSLTFYDDAGVEVGTLDDAIAGWGSLNYYLPAEDTIPDGQMSAVIASDVAVAATASIWNYDFGGADIYLGTLAPESVLSFPLVYRNHTSGNWNSKLTIQNASDTAQTVTLSLYTAGDSTADATDTATIQPYAFFTFDISLSDYAAFGPFGSAVVEGTAPLAGVADNLRQTGVELTAIETTYRAFGGSQQGQEIITPLVYKNYNLWTTGINILNKGASATTVTITYYNANPAVVGGPWVDTLDLGAYAMGLFYTPANAALPNGFYGSAEISSSTTDVVVVAASQRYRADGAQGVAYEGSLPTEATACVSLPVVHNRTTWKTGINIFNLGAVDATVEINYASSNPLVSDAFQTVIVPAGEPFTVYMPSDGTTDLGFYGAADLKSTNDQPLLVNAAHSRMDMGVASNFVGLNYTCP